MEELDSFGETSEILSLPDRETSVKRYIPLGCSITTTCIFFFLWLSESQFGHGILRTRNLNETCAWSLTHQPVCSPGLLCHSDTCIYPPTAQIKCPTVNCSAITCPKCPSRSVKPNSQHVYDYQEHPGYVYDVPRYFRTVYSVDYTGCKGICSETKKCHVIGYQNDARNCWMADRHYSPLKRDYNWTTAIKILYV